VYKSGGAEYLYSYVEILRKEWGDKFLWLDAGDQYIGGLECMLSDCNIMNTFYNAAKVDGITLGNHDFDYEVKELKEKIKNSTFPYICANLYDVSTQSYETFEGKMSRYKVYTVGEVKIGVIGLITVETKTMSGSDLSMYEFHDYKSIVEELSDELRNVHNVDAVILLPHFGPKCADATNEKLNINIRNSATEQLNCSEDIEYYRFISELKEGTVDAVIAGHVHDISHHWINNIPVIESTGSYYAHILHLPFMHNASTNKYELQREKIQIEGPLPACERVFTNTLRCDYVTADNANTVGELSEYTFHGMKVELNAEMNEALRFWKETIEKNITNVIVDNKDTLTIDYNNESALGNVICDGIRIVTGADVAFYNLGAFRVNWYPGKLTDVDVFNMFPFNNTIVSFEMKGHELLRAMQEIQIENKITPTSGIKQVLITKAQDRLVDLKLTSFTFFDGYTETPLDLDKTYTVATNDFLAEGGSVFEPVRQWYELRNEKEYGITRDNMKVFLKAVNVLNSNEWIDPRNPRSIVVYQP
jgi:2',3'-cyclic-nucleotide 2'-phosphodiesterase (5'-nucleotidase family)